MQGLMQVLSLILRGHAHLCSALGSLARCVTTCRSSCVQSFREAHALSKPGLSQGASHLGRKACSQQWAVALSSRDIRVQPWVTVTGLQGRLGARLQSLIQLTLGSVGEGASSCLLHRAEALYLQTGLFKALYCVFSSSFLFGNKTSMCMPLALHHFVQ